ncbi:mandelate racemase/muconate lactonizing enzyme family protein [Hydrogenophaga sp.]|uniref:mandelate racemase/muconate lactonizing enzyme family protein n=1 Tax=Hydrogenophaga sp. TaxID=1904254 RepID=UPI003F6F588D
MNTPRIQDVQVDLLSIPLPRDFRGSVYSVTNKMALLTTIRLDDGSTGISVNGEGDVETFRTALKIARDCMAPALIGEDPSSIGRLWAKCWRLTDTHWMPWQRAAAVRAVACMDCALWDLLGKRAGLPLARMWGGHRDRLPILAIAGQYVDGFAPHDYVPEMEELVELGLAGCKFKVGGLSPEQDADRVRAVRRAMGEDFVICVDANRGWSRPDAEDFARRVRDLGVRWFEEPCHWETDVGDMSHLRRTSDLPIAAGQSEYTVSACVHLMDAQAIDVCNLDASWGGGATPWLKVAAAAETRGIQMAHHGEPLLGAHLLSAVSNGTYVETHHPLRDPLFHGGMHRRGVIQAGEYVLSELPGWGFELDDDFVARHVVGDAR